MKVLNYILIYIIIHLLTGCILTPTITAPAPVIKPRVVTIEPITPETFRRVDTDKDGTLTIDEAMNLPVKPVEGNNNHIWAFIVVVGSVVTVVFFCRPRKVKQSPIADDNESID